ncbi:MAG: AAA family ATPase [bacterium]
MITKIKYKNHPVLANLEIDFTKQGKPCSKIILVGENGSGKSSLINSISDFLCNASLNNIEKIEYKKEDKTHYITRGTNDDHNGHSLPDYVLNKCSNERLPVFIDEIYEDEDGKHHDYDDINCNNVAIKISSETVTSEDLIQIKNMLLSLSNSDDEDFLYKVKNKHEFSENFFENDSRFAIFKKNFNIFFEEKSIECLGIYTIKNNINHYLTNSKKDLWFKKFNNEFDINMLSDGEKRVVFNAAKILSLPRECNKTIFVDEPECNLHPKWQNKSYDFYTSLVSNENSNQFFFTTHSRYFLSCAINEYDNNDVKVVCLVENNGSIEAKYHENFILSPISLSEISFKIFGVEGESYFKELFELLESFLNQVERSAAKIEERDKTMVTMSYIDEYLFNNYKEKCANGYKSRNKEKTLVVYIRNILHHGRSQNTYTNEDLLQCIDLLEVICNSIKVK